jgi:hypothetical protein
MTTKTAVLNIRQRINQVMREVDYVKRASAGQGTGVKYDEVIAKLRPSMIKHGINLEVTEAGQIAKVDELVSKSGSKQSLYQGQLEVRLVNIDEPTDFVSYLVTAHGADNGDKAPGKLNTYAAKVALVKAFALETGENDESRYYKEPESTEAQLSIFTDLCAATSSEPAAVLNYACSAVLKMPVVPFEQLTEQQANGVISMLQAKYNKQQKDAANANQ